MSEKITKSIFGVPLLDFNQKPIENSNILSMLLNVVGNYKSRSGEESIKAYSLGLNLAENKDLDSDKIVLLKKIIGESEIITVLAKGQMLNILKEEYVKK